MKDNFVHLTNNCFQNKSDLFGYFEEGNVISVEQLERYIRESKPEFCFEEILSKMKNLVQEVFMAYIFQMEKNNFKGSYELFGLDFMIDENLKVWLIECNANPYLAVSSKISRGIIEDLV